MTDLEKKAEEFAAQYTFDADVCEFTNDGVGYLSVDHMLTTAYLAGAKENAPKWIKCSERMPPEGRYLAYPNTVGEVGTALFWPESGMWQDLEDHTEPWTPTHWMPLPEGKNA